MLLGTSGVKANGAAESNHDDLVKLVYVIDLKAKTSSLLACLIVDMED